MRGTVFPVICTKIESRQSFRTDSCLTVRHGGLASAVVCLVRQQDATLLLLRCWERLSNPQKVGPHGC